MKTKPIKTESEISIYLQQNYDPEEHVAPARKLCVSFGRGYYKEISTAIIDIEGSPTRGMAVIYSYGHLSGAQAFNTDVWILQFEGRKMKHLPARSKAAEALLKYAKAALQNTAVERTR